MAHPYIFSISSIYCWLFPLFLQSLHWTFSNLDVTFFGSSSVIFRYDYNVHLSRCKTINFSCFPSCASIRHPTDLVRDYMPHSAFGLHSDSALLCSSFCDDWWAFKSWSLLSECVFSLVLLLELSVCRCLCFSSSISGPSLSLPSISYLRFWLSTNFLPHSLSPWLTSPFNVAAAHYWWP